MNRCCVRKIHERDVQLRLCYFNDMSFCKNFFGSKNRKNGKFQKESNQSNRTFKVTSDSHPRNS